MSKQDPEKTSAYGVPCGGCGETIFLYHGDLPGKIHETDLALFTYATGPNKGKSVERDLLACPANGCKWTLSVGARTFDPRMWHELRIG